MDDYAKHYYVAFRYKTDRHGDVIDESKQLIDIMECFRERFSAPPAAVLIGPYSVGGVLLVQSGYVYLQLPERKEKIPAEGSKFSTGYEDK